MKRNYFIVTMIVVVLFALISGISANAAGFNTNSDTYIKAGETLYNAAEGQVYIYEYRMNLGTYMHALDATLVYDAEHLKMLNYVFSNHRGGGGSGQYVSDYRPGEFRFLITAPKQHPSWMLDEDTDFLIRAAFLVKSNNGVFDIHTDIKDMRTGKQIIVNNGETLVDYVHSEVITNPLKKTPQPKVGDADGDGELSSVDVTLIQRCCALMQIGVDEETLMNADVDKNGALEIIDATFIQRHLAGMEIPYPIG